MTRKPTNPAKDESAKQLDLSRHEMKDLDVTPDAAAIKGGLRERKGGDPEDGGE
jgi:hypothetical protein